MKTYYVNPYTRELCCLEATGMDWHRALDALKGQGITEHGSWRPEDFMNWGICSIMKWDFDTYSAPCRRLKLHIDARREKVAQYKQQIPKGRN